ncbi:MAG: acyltransferase [Austwickia sp.]|nr:acyltransferase [Austwickia sp.]
MTDLTLQQRPPAGGPPAPPAVAVRTRAELHQPSGRLDTLDGIRTIAVMLVVLFHVSVPGMRAGFLGVDVFFVLSGYLITTLLIREVDATGKIDLPRFWARRMLRLMPASLLVIAVVIGWGVLAAPAYQRPSLGADVLWSLLYVGNWRFISSSSYFAADGTQSPLQHVWSLAVEEQFYLGWPLILVVATLLFLRRPPQHEAGRAPRQPHGPPRAAGETGDPVAPGGDTGHTPVLMDVSGALDAAAARRRHAQDRTHRLRRIALVVGVLAAVHVVVSAAALWVLYDPAAPDRAYMGTDAKAFEPLIGAVAAAVMQTPRARRFVIRYAELLMLTGLLGILVGILNLADTHGPKQLYFAGGSLVFAMLCALLVVGAAFTRDDFGIGRILAWGPVAYLGRISYGIYLWHWPLAVWAGTHPQWRPAQAAGVVAATIALAALSFHFFEQPIRTGRPAALPSWQTLSTGGVTIMVVALSSGLLGGTPISSIVPAVGQAPDDKTVVVVGDSVARRLVPALAQQGLLRDLTVLNAARGGCPALGINVVGDDGALVNGVDCAAEVPKSQTEVIAQARPSAVLWWSRYELADRQGETGRILKAGTPAFWEAQRVSLATTVDRLSATGATVVIVEVDRVGLGINGRCTPASCPGFLRALRDNDSLRTTWNAMVRQYAATDTRVRLVTMDDVYCRTVGNPCSDLLPMRRTPARAGTAVPGPPISTGATSPVRPDTPPATAPVGAPQPSLWPPLGQFPAPDGSGLARPDGSHFREEAVVDVAEVLLDRLQAVLPRR